MTPAVGAEDNTMRDSEKSETSDDAIDEEDAAWDRAESRHYEQQARRQAARRMIPSDVDPYSAEYYWCIERGMLGFFTRGEWPE